MGTTITGAIDYINNQIISVKTQHDYYGLVFGKGWKDLPKAFVPLTGAYGKTITINTVYTHDSSGNAIYLTDMSPSTGNKTLDGFEFGLNDPDSKQYAGKAFVLSVTVS